MSKANALLRQSQKAIKDLGLLKVIQSEIRHELSSDTFQESRSSSLGDFKIEWDSPKTQDLVLKKKYESGEEVAVSALLGEFTRNVDDLEREGKLYPRDVLMKVCLRKPGVNSILQFNCSIYENGSSSGWDIHNASFLQLSAGLGPFVYRGPQISTLKLWKLEAELREYLESKGIEESLTNFILHHLHKKEQDQYVNWLHTLELYVAKSE